MSRICQCSTSNDDNARFCYRCGASFEAMQQAPAAVPAKPAGSNAWKFGLIGGVVVLGGLCGVSMAVLGSRAGGGTTQETFPTSRSTDTKSSFQEAFEASFKRSCRQSAMRSGNVSESTANSYCDCALNVFHQSHSMTKAAATCRQYVGR